MLTSKTPMDKFASYMVWLFCVQDFVVAAVYLCGGNLRLAGYWLAAALMMASIPK
jgi:hypothetical protein